MREFDRFLRWSALIVSVSTLLYLGLNAGPRGAYTAAAVLSGLCGSTLLFAKPRRVELVRDREVVRERVVYRDAQAAPGAGAARPVRQGRPVQPSRPDLGDPAVQLRNLQKAERVFRKTILGREESAVYYAARDSVAKEQKPYLVFAQVSLGEIIGVEDGDERVSGEAFSAFNSKRVDVLVCDRQGLPVLAIEHQGSGHYQGNAAERDKVKAEAYRLAGIDLLETRPGMDREALRREIRRRLTREGR